MEDLSHLSMESSGKPAQIAQSIPAGNDAAEMKKYVTIVYALFGFGLLLGGLPAIAGLIMAYIKRGEFEGTLYGGHLGLLIRTFWLGLALAVVGVFTSFLVIGVFILIGATIWYIYRLVRGFVCLNDNKPIW